VGSTPTESFEPSVEMSVEKSPETVSAGNPPSTVSAKSANQQPHKKTDSLAPRTVAQVPTTLPAEQHGAQMQKSPQSQAVPKAIPKAPPGPQAHTVRQQNAHPYEPQREPHIILPLPEFLVQKHGLTNPGQLFTNLNTPQLY
jgi:hypothetical protein